MTETETLAILLFQEDISPRETRRNWFSIPREDRARYRKTAQEVRHAKTEQDIEDAYRRG